MFGSKSLATLYLICFCSLSSARVRLSSEVSEVSRSLGSEVGEIQSLAVKLAELCNHVSPEIDAYHNELRSSDYEIESRLSLLKPMWKDLSAREIAVQNIRSEKAKQQGRYQADTFAIQRSGRGLPYVVQQLKNRSLLLSENLIRTEQEKVKRLRAELSTLKRDEKEAWGDFIQRRNTVRENLDRQIFQLLALRQELVRIEELLREPRTGQLQWLRLEQATHEGRLNLVHNQLLGEEMTLKSVRSQVATIENELGRRTPLAYIPPALPAICERVR